MATKDWFKTGNLLYRKEYQKRGFDIKILEISLGKPKRVRVLDKAHHDIVNKLFKTKAQALKFAKSYMKKH